MTDAHDETIETVETGVASSPGRRSADQAAEASRRMPASSERFNPLWELTLARVREFIREPEALFWVFVFPVLLAFALGIAFRNTAPEKNRIAIEADPANAVAAEQLAAALNASADIQAFAFSSSEAARALRTGKVALVVRAAAAQGSS